MKLFQNLPLRKKLSRIIAISSLFALIFSTLLVVMYDTATFRQRVLDEVAALTEIYSINIPASLHFNFPNAAQENLRSLESRKPIRLACIYRKDRTQFTKYVRNDHQEECPSLKNEHHSDLFIDGFLESHRPLVYNSELEGFILYRYELPSFFSRMSQYWIILSVITLSLIIASLLVSVAVEKNVSWPILSLANTAELIGKSQSYHLRATKIHDDEVGSLTVALNTMLEMTENSLKALKESESRFRRLFESNLLGIAFFNINGSFTKGNEYFLKVIQRSREELESNQIKWEEITPKEFHNIDNDQLKRLLVEGIVEIYEKEFVRKDGTRVPVLLAAAKFEGSKEEGVAFILDITELKKATKERDTLLIQETQARQEAERALKVRDDFLSIAAHELRTPITPLKMQFNILKIVLERNPDFPWSVEIKKLISISEGQLIRLTKLIDELLDVSRIRTGRLTLQYEFFDLGVLLEQVLENFRVILQEQNIPLKENISKGIVGHWDKLRIEQIVNNLMTNAIKYGNGKLIEIRLEKTEELAILTVRDHGIGIPSEDQERIFQRFERAVSPEYFGGFGLGLYIAKQIVEAHRGTINVHSVIGEGSVFTVRLPLQERTS